MLTRNQQRQQIRERRRAMSEVQQKSASIKICQHIISLNSYQNAAHIAGFLAFDGEIDIQLLLKQAVESGKTAYLPILLGKGKPMMFAPYYPDKTLKENYYGILEPDVPAADWIAPAALDLVLTPLVAFDRGGNRLGVGGGFYDRSFAFLNDSESLSGTRLLGIAYEFQCLDHIAPEPWDVPLHGIVTEAGLYPGCNGFMLS